MKCTRLAITKRLIRLVSSKVKRSRTDTLKLYQEKGGCDILIVGGGSTGCGAALDATLRGMSVLCIEREDFASATSSRSTKLLWGGSRYLVQAFVSLLSFRLIKSPLDTWKNFVSDFKMVLNCHKERTALLKNQPHLTYWQPIAVPLTSWLQWPPPFGFYLASLGPLGLYPLFFKFYDALSGFKCPPSHIMTPNRAKRKFPQLSNNKIKYCSVFYEGMHDDARTCLSLALTASREGANMLNYCEAIEFLHDDHNNKNKITGAIIKDLLTNTEYKIHAKSILFCGGPFTDELRKKEDNESKRAVTGSSGIHIVLPNYYAPGGIGMVDMNTSDGRFLFFLPWHEHIIVGTTDRKCEPSMHPEPHESEIRWLLHEASKYLSPELRLRRHDVLSAWCGVRPLATDPHSNSSSNGSSDNTSKASRDHVISHNPKTGIVFVSGGKWTTYREMAEDAINKILEVHPEIEKSKMIGKCKTLQTHLIGYEGYSSNLEIRLIQQYGITYPVAHRLARAYGGRAYDVLQLDMSEFYTASNNSSDNNNNNNNPKNLNNNNNDIISSNNNHHQKGQYNPHNIIKFHHNHKYKLLIPGYPIIESEVIFAIRYEWAYHAEDILARRTRLAFLNKDAAIQAIPRVIQLFAIEFQWTIEQQKIETERCFEYMRHFGGPIPNETTTATREGKTARSIRMATEGDLMDIFDKINVDKSGYITRLELRLASEMLNHPLTEDEINDCFDMAKSYYHKHNIVINNEKLNKINYEIFSLWWNSDRMNRELETLKSKVTEQQQIPLFG